MIKKLQVENFKCFANSIFNFNNLTFLTGGNACGKSSLIQLLLLLSNVEENGDYLSIFPRVGNVNLGLPEKLLSSNTNKDVVQVSIESDNETYNIKLSTSDVQNYKKVFIAEGDTKKFASIFSPYYIAAERISPQTFHKSGMKDYYVGANGEFTVEILSLFDQISKTNLEHGFNIPFLSDSPISFKKACDYCLSNIFDTTELQVSGLEDEPGEKLLIKNNSSFYIPFATGFGISYCLPIIVQGLVALLSENKLLIVENPEVHLHPKSQSALGQFLANLAKCGVQVIVETHSEHIINGSRIQMGNEANCNLMKVIYFDKNESGFAQKEINLNEYGELSEWPEGFFDQEEKDLRELLIRKIQRK